MTAKKDREKGSGNTSQLHKETSMKGTTEFEKIIKSYLDRRAETDKLFRTRYTRADKSIGECINYIITTVKDSGCSGFIDDEIYSMAVHYYDEENDSLKIEKVECSVVVNHHVELTEEEKEKARQEVYDNYKRSLTRKSGLQRKDPKIKDEKKLATLFDF